MHAYPQGASGSSQYNEPLQHPHSSKNVPRMPMHYLPPDSPSLLPPSSIARPRYKPHWSRGHAEAYYKPLLRGHGQSPPALLPPATSRVLLRAATQTDSRPPDYWHDSKRLLSINFGSKEQYPWSISFIPLLGPCKHGVALLNLELGKGMYAHSAPISDELPPRYARYQSGVLEIKWPGYKSVEFPLTLVDYKTERHITRGQMGAQVTQLFKDFINMQYEGSFDETSDGFFLGIDGVQYDQVRLAEVYTADGIHWQAQFGLVPHFLLV
uniref:Uncharacterized protein n=1 Tax=Mycena chlorophos TaxID=658473 RepID=A0ABQ0KV04_MYCCL|nr:predicted protein [Mycena chlorophos]